MRKLSTLTTLLTAAALTAVSFGSANAHYRMYVHKKPPPSVRSASHVGPWAVGCGIASAGSLMIGTAIHAGDKNDPRQLTINEAAWHSSACPFLLPWALIVQATCPDNKATYQIAHLALAYINKHPGASEAAFTEAYAEACHTGKLTRGTLRALKALI